MSCINKWRAFQVKKKQNCFDSCHKPRYHPIWNTQKFLLAWKRQECHLFLKLASLVKRSRISDEPSSHHKVSITVQGSQCYPGPRTVQQWFLPGRERLLEDFRRIFDQEDRERRIGKPSLVRHTSSKSLSCVPDFPNVAVLFRQFYLINIYFSFLYAAISIQLLEPSSCC